MERMRKRRLLKAQLRRLLKQRRLIAAHYTAFKEMTAYFKSKYFEDAIAPYHVGGMQ